MPGLGPPGVGPPINGPLGNSVRLLLAVSPARRVTSGELYPNNAITTLASAIGPSDNSLVLASIGTPPQMFPTSGSFTLLIESEYIRVGATDGTFCASLTRGAEGSGPASGVGVAHAAGVQVEHILTAGALRRVSGGGFVGITSVNTPYQAAATDSLVEFFNDIPNNPTGAALQLLLYQTPYIGQQITIIYWSASATSTPPLVTSTGAFGLEDVNAPGTVRAAGTPVAIRAVGQRLTLMADDTRWVLAPGS